MMKVIRYIEERSNRSKGVIDQSEVHMVPVALRSPVGPVNGIGRLLRTPTPTPAPTATPAGTATPAPELSGTITRQARPPFSPLLRRSLLPSRRRTPR